MPLAYFGNEVLRAVDSALGLAFDYPIVAIKAFAGLAALSSLVSNCRALTEVYASIVTCERPFDFRGRRLGASEPYIVPLRKLFFWYALFTFYQLVSQVTGAVGQPTPWGIATEFALQGMLVSLVFFRWRSIRKIAKGNYQDQDQKVVRFNRLFDEALADKRISISVLLGSVAIYPIAALAPGITEILLERPGEFSEALSAATSIFKG